MKKYLKKIISKIIFIISFIPYVIVMFNVVKCFFFGYEVVMMWGLDIPLSYGLRAVYNYLWFTFSFNCFGIITIPIIIICIVYQIAYFKRIRQILNTNK